MESRFLLPSFLGMAAPSLLRLQVVSLRTGLGPRSLLPGRRFSLPRDPSPSQGSLDRFYTENLRVDDASPPPECA